MAAINSFQNPFQGLGQGGGLNLPSPQLAPSVDPLARGMDMYNSLSAGQRASAELEMQKQAMQQKMLEVEGEKRKNAYFMKNYDPATNTVDHVKYMLDVGEDPLTTKYAIDAYKWLADNDQTQAQTAKTALDNNQTKTDMMARQSFALLDQYASQGKHVPKGAASAQVADWLAKGWVTGDQAQSITLGMVGPEEGSPQLDASFKRAAMQGQNSAEVQKRLQGEISTIDSGNRTDILNTGMGGQTSVVGHVDKNLTPDQANEIVKLDQPDGSTIQVRKGDIAAQQGQQAPGQAPGGLNPIGQSQTQRQGLETAKTVETNSKYADDLQTQGQQAQSNLGTLDIAEKNLKGLNTGGGGDYYLSAAKIAQSIGADPALVAKLAGGNIDQAEVVNSLNTLLSVQQFKNITGQPNRDLANQEFARMVGTGFSLNNTPEANKRILSFYKGLSQLDAKEAQAFNVWMDPERKGFDKDKHTVEAFRRAWPKAQYKLIKAGILNGGTPLDDEGNPEGGK